MEDRCPICTERLYGGECNQRHKNNLVWERTAYWSKWEGLGIDTFQKRKIKRVSQKVKITTLRLSQMAGTEFNKRREL